MNTEVLKPGSGKPEDYNMTSDALRSAAESTDDLRTMSKNYQHEGGAYWPAFYLNWAADEIEALEAYIVKHLFKIWPNGMQDAPEDDPIHEISRRYCERNPILDRVAVPTEEVPAATVRAEG